MISSFPSVNFQLRKWQAQQTYSWESPTPNATPDFEIGPDMIREVNHGGQNHPPFQALFPRGGWVALGEKGRYLEDRDPGLGNHGDRNKSPKDWAVGPLPERPNFVV